MNKNLVAPHRLSAVRFSGLRFHPNPENSTERDLRERERERERFSQKFIKKNSYCSSSSSTL